MRGLLLRALRCCDGAAGSRNVAFYGGSGTYCSTGGGGSECRGQGGGVSGAGDGGNCAGRRSARRRSAGRG